MAQLNSSCTDPQSEISLLLGKVESVLVTFFAWFDLLVSSRASRSLDEPVGLYLNDITGGDEDQK